MSLAAFVTLLSPPYYVLTTQNEEGLEAIQPGAEHGAGSTSFFDVPISLSVFPAELDNAHTDSIALSSVVAYVTASATASPGLVTVLGYTFIVLISPHH